MILYLSLIPVEVDFSEPVNRHLTFIIQRILDEFFIIKSSESSLWLEACLGNKIWSF